MVQSKQNGRKYKQNEIYNLSQQGENGANE